MRATVAQQIDTDTDITKRMLRFDPTRDTLTKEEAQKLDAEGLTIGELAMGVADECQDAEEAACGSRFVMRMGELLGMESVAEAALRLAFQLQGPDAGVAPLEYRPQVVGFFDRG